MYIISLVAPLRIILIPFHTKTAWYSHFYIRIKMIGYIMSSLNRLKTYKGKQHLLMVIHNNEDDLV